MHFLIKTNYLEDFFKSENLLNMKFTPEQISKYDFHDGILIDIQHSENTIVMSMWSAEIDPDEMEDNIPLSDDTLKGKLHIEGIKRLIVNKLDCKKLKLGGDNGKICDFHIIKNEIKLFIEWRNYKSAPPPVEFSKILIEAEKIYWEPVPDLVDPFW